MISGPRKEGRELLHRRFQFLQYPRSIVEVVFSGHHLESLRHVARGPPSETAHDSSYAVRRCPDGLGIPPIETFHQRFQMPGVIVLQEQNDSLLQEFHVPIHRFQGFVEVNRLRGAVTAIWRQEAG